MHVNSYFIETLVLCFSCGCDKTNLNYGNIRNVPNGTECSMNTPTRMILGKQIQWSETFGDQCDSNGPLQYDLEPIKQIVQLQLLQAPNQKTCTPAKDTGSEYLQKTVTQDEDLEYEYYPDYNPSYPEPDYQLDTGSEYLQKTITQGHYISRDPISYHSYLTPYPDTSKSAYSISQVEDVWNPAEDNSESETTLYTERPEDWAKIEYPKNEWPSLLDLPGRNASLTYVITTTGNRTVTNPLGDGIQYSQDMLDFIQHYPDGNIVIIIANGEAPDDSWHKTIYGVLSNSKLPTYVMTVDWSKYVFPNYLVTASYAKVVADDVVKWLHNNRIPSSRLTLIGFGTNAHTAGFIGKHMQQNFGETIFKIIALNPTGMAFSPDSRDKLDRGDAKQVLVIHTESNNIGYCCNLGTLDVIVNNPEQGQPWCEGQSDRAHCSHISAIDIFNNSLTRQVLVEKEYTKDVLLGFPLEVSLDVTGVYQINTNSYEQLPLVPYEYWPAEDYAPDSWPSMPKDMSRYNAENIKIIGMSSTDKFEKLFPVLEQTNYFNDLLNQYPISDIIVIITKEHYQDWAIELREEYLRHPENKYIIIVDWSMYVYNSRLFTAAYSKVVAETFYRWMLSVGLHADKVKIIGFSTSAHAAGIVGYYHWQNGKKIHSIVGLDPEGGPWLRETELLTKASASVVQVVHTNTQNLGHPLPLGSYDIYVNGGPYQPHCQGNQLDECSHKAAILYYLESISVQTFATEGTLQNGIAVVSGVQKIPFGYFLEPDNAVTATIFVLETNGPHLIPAPPHTWPRESPDYLWPPINPNLTNGYNANDIKLIGISGGDSYEKLFPVREPTNFFITWEQEHPYSEIIVIITEEQYKDWAVKLRQELLKLTKHKYVLIVDWSMYVFQSQRFTASYALLVAYTLNEWLTRSQFPTHKVEVIGFSMSAHVAGLIGHYQTQYGQKIHRIAALEPAAYGGWSHPLQLEKLSASSADVVQVVHTNTRNYGYFEPLGIYDIYVNGGATQPMCEENVYHMDECSHRAAITYYMESVTIHAIATEATLKNRIAVISGPQIIVFGHWLIPDNRITANIFNLETYDKRDGSPTLLKPPVRLDLLDLNQKDPTNIKDWPPYNPDPKYMQQDITQLILNIFYKNGNDEIAISANIPERIPPVDGLIQTFTNVRPNSPTYMIINGEHDRDFTWASELKNIILAVHPLSIVVLLDWSAYKYKSYIATSNFVKPIGYTLADAFYNVHVPTNMIHLIGHSMGSYIASFLGKAFQERYSQTIYRITGLDPSRPMWYHQQVAENNKLTKSDAVFVDVIHTNGQHLGYPAPTGTADFYVNGGKIQPNCPEYPYDTAECSHRRSITYFIESFDTKAIVLKVKYQDESKLIFLENTEFAVFGYHAQLDKHGSFYIKTEINAPYLKRLNGFKESQANLGSSHLQKMTSAAGFGQSTVRPMGMLYNVTPAGASRESKLPRNFGGTPTRFGGTSSDFKESKNKYGGGILQKNPQTGGFGGNPSSSNGGNYEKSESVYAASGKGNIEGGSNFGSAGSGSGATFSREPWYETQRRIYVDDTGPVETDHKQEILLIPGDKPYG